MTQYHTISITAKYFRWIEKGLGLENYYQLLNCLNNIEYVPAKSMDYNRYADGMSYRIRFADDMGLNHDDVREVLNGPCSMLEMMGAFAMRIEEITDYCMSKYGRWFVIMLDSLGLLGQTDGCYDENYIRTVCSNFMAENYLPNGQGSLFTTVSNVDMRKLELWYQCQRYLVENNN